MVPLGTPARRAMSSSLVAANPRSAKTSSAALTISSGRASLRRRQRGFAGFGRFVAVRMRGRNLVTKRSVSKVGSPQTGGEDVGAQHAAPLPLTQAPLLPPQNAFGKRESDPYLAPAFQVGAGTPRSGRDGRTN